MSELETIYGANVSDYDREIVGLLNEEIDADGIYSEMFDPQAAETASREVWEAEYEEALNLF